jgi:uncharacterized protein (DUF342 family)
MKVVTEDIRRRVGPEVYDENVRIDGAVRTGAGLKVHGDLAIHGNVEDAVIEADGRVRIYGGFLGSGAGKITCGGNFSATFVQGQRIDAGGNVAVEKAVISGTVFARGNVTVSSDVGAIVGGWIHAGGSVEAAVLGSRRPVQTRIEAGADPVVSRRIEALEREVMELTRRRMDLLKNAGTLSGGRMREVEDESDLDMKAASDAMQAGILAVGEEIAALRGTSAFNTKVTVKAHKACYPPLEITICLSKMLYDKEIGPVVFRLFDDRIILDTWNLE